MGIQYYWQLRTWSKLRILWVFWRSLRIVQEIFRTINVIIERKVKLNFKELLISCKSGYSLNNEKENYFVPCLDWIGMGREQH